MISNLEHASPHGKSDHCVLNVDFNCWSYIKSKSKTREGIGDLHTNPEGTNSEKTEDNKEKANILSDYFSGVFTNEPLGELPQMTPIEIQNELKDLLINKYMVLTLLQNLKIDK
jgi:hypothetical protein